MKNILYLSLCLAAILVSNLAAATPPLTVNIEDRPLAVSETHFYVQRHISDNRGFYGQEHSKTFVIKMDGKSGKTIATHLIYSAYWNHDDREASNVSAPHDFNLFRYLEGEEAFLLPHELETEDNISVVTGYNAHAITQLNERHKNNEPLAEVSTAVVHRDELLQRVNGSIGATLRAYIGPIPDPLPNVEFYAMSTEFEHRCDLTKISSLPAPFSVKNNVVLFLSCPAAYMDEGELSGHIALPLALEFPPPLKP